jgi:hypothetical protein
MNKLFTLFICGLLLCATTVLPGCAGSGKTVAYKTLKAVSDSVDMGMKAFAEATVKGVIDDGTQAKVKGLHDQYRIAFQKAVVAAQFDYATAAPAEVAGLAAELTALIATYIK